METGYRGTFVISWQQTEIDGCRAAAIETLRTGSIWRWTGNSVRLDGPTDILSLGDAIGSDELREKAARAVGRMAGIAMKSRRSDADPAQDWDEWLMDGGFVVTDGTRTFTIQIFETANGKSPLLMSLDHMPPADVKLWVVRAAVGNRVALQIDRTAGGVICFTPGTRMMTPDGPKPIESLQEGDALQTKDSGAQTIRWIGQRRMTGAQLSAMPHLRPVRIRAGALNEDQPDADILVSPDHRLLIRGAQAKALFNADEVLVSAKDLVNDRDVTIAHDASEITYIHVAMARHEIVWANGLETESFHPGNAAISSIEHDQRERLMELFPAIADDPENYGPFARRNLNSAEAAILRHDGVFRH